MNAVITDVYETGAGIHAVLCIAGEDDRDLRFRPSLWLEAGVHAGDTLDQEALETLLALSTLTEAIDRAEALIANSIYSRKRLVTRLRRYGFSQDVCERAADYCVSEGYIKEKEQARRLALAYCRTKHWGRRRIVAELIARGYEKEHALTAADRIPDAVYETSLRALMEKKYPAPAEDAAAHRRRTASLSRMGWSYEEIKRAGKVISWEEEE